MKRAVLLMAYGTPEQPAQVEPYFTHIRGGRQPSAEAVERLKSRYARVGGRTPLLDITNEVRSGLERELGHPVYVGMKHWHPFIGEVIPRIVEEGATEIVAVALAPHYSKMSIGGYRKAVDEALEKLPRKASIHFVDSWHMNVNFLELIADRVREGLRAWDPVERAQVVTVFSAHSLPVRIQEWNDPYEAQLMQSCRAVVTRAGLDHWGFAWQSAGETGEPWLGPDIVKVLENLHDDGTRHVLSVPIGFVSDHLEVLYDIDCEARDAAERLGMTLRRTRMPNADPAFVRTLASVVRFAA